MQKVNRLSNELQCSLTEEVLMKQPRRALPGLIAIPLLFAMLLSACAGSTTNNPGSTNATSSTSAVTLNIFAAASLTESFKEIGTAYHAAHPNVTLKFNFAGSQILEQQIANGASADIFASADQANMQKATAANLVKTSQVFARNKIVVIVPASNPAHINTLKDLANKGIKLVMAAKTVPVGKYGLQVLDNLAASPDYGASYKSAVLANVVSQEDNVKAVVQKVQLNEADAGIVYLTDVTPTIISKVHEIIIPDNVNVIATYPIATVSASTHASTAQDVIQYILSSSGQATLQKYHFIPAVS